MFKPTSSFKSDNKLFRGGALICCLYMILALT